MKKLIQSLLIAPTKPVNEIHHPNMVIFLRWSLTEGDGRLELKAKEAAVGASSRRNGVPNARA